MMTESGNPQSVDHVGFETTRWSLILSAQTGSPARCQAVLEELCRVYWRPVYCYLKAKGHQDAEALDITQDFFTESILGRHLFDKADRRRGRFRPFLLHCLKNFVRNWRRRERSGRRSPDRPVLDIDDLGDQMPSRLGATAPNASPEAVFEREWAISLMERAVLRLRAYCEEFSLGVHFDIFNQRFIRPAQENVPSVPLAELAEHHHLTPKQAANRCKVVRHRFRKLLLDEVGFTVNDAVEAEEELQSLMLCLREREASL